MVNYQRTGMSDLVDWYEDDLRERKLEQSKEIESFNELNKYLIIIFNWLMNIFFIL